MAMISRLREQMAVNSINARELAEKAAVGRSFVYDILNGKSANPTVGKLSAIAGVLGVSVEYLIEGKGSDKSSVVFPQGFAEDGLGHGGVISIPGLAVEAAAGGNLIVNDGLGGKEHLFQKSWVESKLKLDSQDLRVVFVEGDNMEPTLADGDMLLIDLKRNKISPPGIFVIFDGRNLMARRLEQVSGEDINRVISDNKMYDSYDAKEGDIEVIGRVVWFSRELK